jgi:hypothetical protein
MAKTVSEVFVETCRYSGRWWRFRTLGIRSTMSMGAAAMSLSTIIVAANAQLLRRLKLQGAIH